MAQRMGRGIALFFHDRGTRRGWVVSSTPRPHFTLGKDPVPILQEVGWAPGPVWTGGKSRPHRDSIPDRPARSQSLYRPTKRRVGDRKQPICKQHRCENLKSRTSTQYLFGILQNTTPRKVAYFPRVIELQIPKKAALVSLPPRKCSPLLCCYWVQTIWKYENGVSSNEIVNIHSKFLANRLTAQCVKCEYMYTHTHTHTHSKRPWSLKVRN